MAWTRQLPSGRYQGMYRDATGKIRSAGSFPRENQALTKATTAEENERINPTDARAARITWGEWLPEWSAVRTVSASSRTRDDRRIALHLTPTWEKVKLRDITTHRIQRWVRELEEDKHLAPKSVILCYRLLSASLKAAVAARLLPSTPCVGIVLPKSATRLERVVTDDELDEICEHLSEAHTLAVRLMGGTGMRLGEALALHWESVDLERRTITICRSWDPLHQLMKSTKTFASRTVPISRDLADTLSVVLDEHGPGQPAPPPITYTRDVAARTGLVLRGSRGLERTHGRPLDGSSLRTQWVRAIASANVLRKESGREQIADARLHDLRHTYASRLVRAGVPIVAVKDLMGHSTIVTTMRYSHAGEAAWDSVRAVLGDDVE